MENKPIEMEIAEEQNPSDASAVTNSNAGQAETAGSTTVELNGQEPDGLLNSTRSSTRTKARKPDDMIPEHLWAREEIGAQITVPVDNLAIRAYSPEQVATLRETLGMIDINSRRLTSLPEFGKAARSMGILDTINGLTLLNQDVLSGQLIRLNNIAHDNSLNPDGTPKYTDDQKAEATKALTEIAKVISKVNSAAVKSDVSITQTKIEADKHRKASFAPARPLAPRPVKLAQKPE